MNDEIESLHAVKQSPWHRRAELMQWFGMVMFVLAIGLAALTDFLARREGIATIVLFVALGLLAMVASRLILGTHLMRHP
ncbi:hypothetical protein [Pseudomonas sp. SCB32]|uniref:hypothetical protein n=1 Tax=Pseudomonas sp. SCB32 TaxID=2653853 RepID=UPI001264CDE3|nr:hypothetical protein [Pseudomonas sp. SCB32]